MSDNNVLTYFMLEIEESGTDSSLVGIQFILP